MNTVAARSASRAVSSGLTGLLVATLSIATPAVVHAGVDGAAGAPGPIAARAKFLAANDLIVASSVQDKDVFRIADADPSDVGPALTTYLELHGRAVDDARATLMPLMAPVPQ